MANNGVLASSSDRLQVRGARKEQMRTVEFVWSESSVLPEKVRTKRGDEGEHSKSIVALVHRR